MSHGNTTAGAPIITCDGPSGSGKGTVSRALASRLGWHLLDSGALYRLVALMAQRRGLAASTIDDVNTDLSALCEQAANMRVRFEVLDGGRGERVWLSDEDVTSAIRNEQAGNLASSLAARPEIRRALLDAQHHFRQAPGLVADGRDMGTVVFPDAQLKLYLTASAAERARRRFEQLSDEGANANLDRIYSEISARDERDRKRKHSPLLPAADAVELDTTGDTVEESLRRIETLIRERGLSE
ncbi:MAG: cytidylate kinase [Salinisphaeraceae bacterium]|nr:cytidylate kinase [Salinisphaeraceae bacterium]